MTIYATQYNVVPDCWADLPPGMVPQFTIFVVRTCYEPEAWDVRDLFTSFTPSYWYKTLDEAITAAQCHIAGREYQGRTAEQWMAHLKAGDTT